VSCAIILVSNFLAAVCIEGEAAEMFASKTTLLFYLLSFISLLYNTATGQDQDSVLYLNNVVNYGLLTLADMSCVDVVQCPGTCGVPSN